MILAMAEGPARTAELAAWVQSLFASESRPPVLVGGAAVELYTNGAYTTGDLDFVGDVTPSVAAELARGGFERHGRHWIHEGGQVFLEFPSSSLGPKERTQHLRIGDVSVLAISVEDLLIDRLGAWLHWKSATDGANAYVLWTIRRSEIDVSRVQDGLAEQGFEAALESLVEFDRRHASAPPQAADIEQWAVNGPT